MKLSCIPLPRWLAATLMMGGALLSYTRDATASQYWLEVEHAYNYSGCTYDFSGHNIWAWGDTGSGLAGGCAAITNQDSTAYSYCGTTQPVGNRAGVGYWDSTGFNLLNWTANLSWGTLATETIQPAYKAGGGTANVCAANSYVQGAVQGQTK